jgi:hypothetical protein
MDILRLWKELLPELAQHDPKHWHKTRQTNLQKRWRETAANCAKEGKPWATSRDGLHWFAKLFRHIRESRFLMGRVPPIPPRTKPFELELQWLLEASHWADLMEGKYHTEG